MRCGISPRRAERHKIKIYENVCYSVGSAANMKALGEGKPIGDRNRSEYQYCKAQAG